jgi:tRNA modification GTPase
MVGERDDVIVAPATAPGRGAVAMVRLSGHGATAIASRLAGRRTWVPRRATRATLQLADGLTDDALVTIFAAPQSYTGQDVVEFSTHGSPVVVESLVKACVAAGARLATPGEFTFRAYLNGRLDLLQAEAVADLVNATTPAQIRVASAHLEGALSAHIRELGDELASLRALLEASLDFPDEGFHFITPEALALRLDALRAACSRLLTSADAGQRLHDGATVVIAGRPNAGKSSLFNALVGRRRAIVAEVPGTTRDLVTEHVTVGGVPVTLVDTAGLRATSDAVEREGVARAEEAVQSADLVLFVVNPHGTDEDHGNSEVVWESLPQARRVLVTTRADLVASGEAGARWWPDGRVAVSSVTGVGIDGLRDLLASHLGHAHWDGVMLTRARHRGLVQSVVASLERATATLAAGGSEEYVLVDVLDGLEALGALRQVESADAVLETIFASFCIGK